MLIDIARAILGLAVLIALGVAFSENRRAIDWKLVGGGLLLQLILALLFLVVPGGNWIFDQLAAFFIWVTDFSQEGAKFVFGPLADPASLGPVFGGGKAVVFACYVLPTIIFFSALCSLLYYCGILQKVVWAFAWVTKRFMKLSGAESLAAAAEIFLGQTESPLMIKPYIDRMNRSEIFALMTGGMATIAGGVLLAYIGFLGGNDPAQKIAFAKFLLCGSFMAAPASLVVAKLLIPQTEQIDDSLHVPKDKLGANLLDALANGTSEGLKLAANVGAMLIAFIAFAALVNGCLAKIHPNLSLDILLGYLFAPVAWIIGVETADISKVGSLIGTKLVFTEFLAYEQLGKLKAASGLAPKSIFLATFALCGFANFASIGIQLGGTGSIAPGQRPTIAALGFKAVLAGTMATLMTATLAGAMYHWAAGAMYQLAK
ncbi:nucleoside transporter C-terminal domain-containing protein [Haloferula sp. BvORR071]|uniref:NupC/NupG family nucleoside CNT transporter n=1 Tax=Haloferula sp. BvORR071 TaxID=1396141 RepID=UPI0006986851|nr:nucleoside transporter C-terminal domain-containing protein [Haloferula sp. BvORR071]